MLTAGSDFQNYHVGFKASEEAIAKVKSDLEPMMHCKGPNCIDRLKRHLVVQDPAFFGITSADEESDDDSNDGSDAEDDIGSFLGDSEVDEDDMDLYDDEE